MALDACVYCDCLEKGRLRKPLPPQVTIEIHPDGYPSICINGKAIWEDHDSWSDFACEHEGRMLVSHCLGNIGLVSVLRGELKRHAEEFPILLGKVVYNGIHAGDWLNLDEIEALKAELEKLSQIKCKGDLPGTFVARMVEGTFQFEGGDYTSAGEADAFMANFRKQMSELVEAAFSVRKPISF